MAGVKRQAGVGRLVPGRRGAALEDVDLGVLGREEVVVARLAADAAGAVHHVGRRHVGVDYGIGLGGAAAAAQARDVLVGLGEETGRGGHGAAPGGRSGGRGSWGGLRVVVRRSHSRGCDCGLLSGEAIGGSGGWHAGDDAGDTGWVGNGAGREGAGTRSAGRGRAGVTAECRVGATAENERHLDRCA